jgi:hypothetical protein
LERRPLDGLEIEPTKSISLRIEAASVGGLFYFRSDVYAPALSPAVSHHKRRKEDIERQIAEFRFAFCLTLPNGDSLYNPRSQQTIGPTEYSLKA